MIRKVALPLAALAMLVFAIYHVVRAQQTPPKLDPPVQPARSPFGKGVAGAGLVEAQTENISVGSHLPGIVQRVLVKVGDKAYKDVDAPVQIGDRVIQGKGTPLFVLDDRALRAEWAVRQAALLSARAQLEKLQQLPRAEELPPLQARVRELQAQLVDREDQLRRVRRLSGSRAVSDEERIRTEQTVFMAREQLRKAEADLELLKAGAWKPDLLIAQAAVQLAEAQLRQTETELERLVVRALVDGEVLQVSVRPGEFVGAQPGQALIVLGNVNQLHVRVDIDEHDIPRLQPGAPARAMLRGDPRQEFPLRFVRVEPYVIPKKSLTGDNTERVDTRVLQVIFAIENSSPHRLYVGQQVDVYIDTEVKN
jgi:HlyD family secretion protein